MAAKNVTATMSAPARLSLLLPWINGDSLSRKEIADRIAQFCVARTAGDAIGLYASEEGGRWRGGIANFTDEMLEELRIELRTLFDATTRHRTITPRAMSALPSLRFTIARTRDRADKLSALSHRERQSYLGPGAYQMIVYGHLRDVLLYQVMRTLTEPGAVALTHCPAPAPLDWSHQCGRWLIALGKRRGRPGNYCSTSCRVRAHRKHASDRQRRRK